MLARQINSLLEYKKYKVISFDSNDTTYFLEYEQYADSQKIGYCWCRADQVLNLRSQVEGYLCPSNNKHELPTLVVSQSNSTVPTVKRTPL
ncbi:hypothetical protein NIES4071_55270 [Calothrix sp. NIES-4071]|nr:hypothetical protein NIES4071_55270 [Calothrix sp. NIES-4071]BAZ59834.1 hypothetical protein NIES4105_55220 [Calothrix sp. NIES-4105]